MHVDIVEKGFLEFQKIASKMNEILTLSMQYSRYGEVIFHHISMREERQKNQSESCRQKIKSYERGVLLFPIQVFSHSSIDLLDCFGDKVSGEALGRSINYVPVKS